MQQVIAYKRDDGDDVTEYDKSLYLLFSQYSIGFDNVLHLLTRMEIDQSIVRGTVREKDAMGIITQLTDIMKRVGATVHNTVIWE